VRLYDAPPSVGIEMSGRTIGGIEQVYKAAKSDEQDALIRRMRVWTWAQFSLCLAGAFVAILTLELRWVYLFNDWDREAGPLLWSSWFRLMKLFVTFTTVLQWFPLWMYYNLTIKYQIQRKLLPVSAKLWNTSHLLPFTIELIITTIHCPPGVYLIRLGEGDYFNVENLLTVMMVLRIYLVLRLICLYSVLLTAVGRYIRAMSNLDLEFPLITSNPLIYKIYLQRYPFMVPLCGFALLVVLSSYCTWVFERWPALVSGDSSDDDRMHYKNMIWLTFISVTTVGYGDTFPKTTEGRAVIVIAVSCGLVLTALIISVIQTQTSISEAEKKIIDFIEKENRRKQYKKCAASIVGIVVRRWKSKSRRSRPPSEVKLYSSIKSFKTLRRAVKEDERTMFEEPSEIAQLIEIVQGLDEKMSRLLLDQKPKQTETAAGAAPGSSTSSVLNETKKSISSLFSSSKSP